MIEQQIYTISVNSSLSGIFYLNTRFFINEPVQEFLVLITSAGSEGSDEPVSLSSFARAFAAHIEKVGK